MEKEVYIVKRNGEKEKLSYDKINKVLLWATEDINGVSASDIAMNAKLQIIDGIKTSEIHRVLIQSTNELISEKTPNYQYVAANLLNYFLRKEIFNTYHNLPHLKDVIFKNISLGVYDKTLGEKFEDYEYDKLNSYINHNRDLKFTYAGLQQLVDKYLLRDRKTNVIYETPQYMYMCIAMTLFADYDKTKRIQRIKSYYDDISKLKINLPTPIMSGVRTPSRGWSSCTLIDVDDTLKSIYNSNTALGYYTANRSGIGLNLGRIRSIGDKVRGGEVIHTGVIPFLKMFESTSKSCTQNGIRTGAMTVHFPFWHKEIEDILVLKNNKGTDETRVRKCDYSIQFSKIFYRRFIENKNITLFSPADVTDLYESFGNNEIFDELYEKYEKSKTINKKEINARELMNNLVQERISTGRIYIMNIDNVNSHSPFLDKIYMSNLCVAPETKILTDKGYEEISKLENKNVNVWNGSEWSNVKVVKTGENQKLIKINFSNGQSIECTPYHKFYVQVGYHRGTGKNKLRILEKRAHELLINDKIIKLKTPIIEFQKELEDSYTQGFFSGDGCRFKEKNHIDLYGEKIKLKEFLNFNHDNRYNEKQDRIRIHINNDFEKFFVPKDYNINSRLRWLEGIFDSDGVVCLNGDNQSLQISSVNINFLKDVHLLLQTLGVQSKVVNGMGEGFKLLPKNDGTDDKKEYFCKESKRLLIGSDALYNLMLLGFNPKRLKVTLRKPNRNAEQFIKVSSIEDNNRIDDTFCVTEPLKNKVVFNGIITGNCQEINLPTKPITHIDDEDGEIALCVLSAINLGELKTLEELEGICENIVYGLDYVIENQYYPVKAAEKMKKRRSIGVGVTNFAYYLAKNGYGYKDKETLEFVDKLFEHIQYYLIKASINLSKEFGSCEYYNRTKWSKGLLTIDHYNKNVDNLVKRELSLDWEFLREELKKYGIRNSTLSALMPCESSSLVCNSTNGIEPVRNFITIKKSKQGTIKMVLPELNKLKNKYELAFSIDNKSINNIVSVIQKWTCQGISVNHYYNAKNSEDGNISISDIVKDILQFYQFGGKQIYYANSNDGKTDNFEKVEKEVSNEQENEELLSCEGGACSI